MFYRLEVIRLGKVAQDFSQCEAVFDIFLDARARLLLMTIYETLITIYMMVVGVDLRDSPSPDGNSGFVSFCITRPIVLVRVIARFVLLVNALSRKGRGKGPIESDAGRI